MPRFWQHCLQSPYPIHGSNWQDQRTSNWKLEDGLAHWQQPKENSLGCTNPSRPADWNQNGNTDNPPSKFQLGAFLATTGIGSKRSFKPSVYTINKLKEKKYIKLYCFSPAGCCDHANQRLSTTDKALGFTYGISASNPTNTSLTLKPLSALSHPGKVIPDSKLTWEQVQNAKACYLNHVSLARWNLTHMQAFVTFIINLDSHLYNVSLDNKQALVWYQVHACKDWHHKLGTAESYNLALLNKDLLAKFKEEAHDLSVQNHVAQVSNPSQPQLWTPLTLPPPLHHMPTQHTPGVSHCPTSHPPCTTWHLTPHAPLCTTTTWHLSHTTQHHAPHNIPHAPCGTPHPTQHPTCIMWHPHAPCGTPSPSHHAKPLCTTLHTHSHTTCTSHGSHPILHAHTTRHDPS